MNNITSGFAMPKPIQAPKIASIHVSKPNGGGVIVRHNMTHGPRPKAFVFADPWKAKAHLAKIQSSAWRQPDQNVAGKMTHDLGLGPVV